MKHFNLKQQGGFIGVIFLAIALIGIVIAAIAMMSRDSASGTASEKRRTDVSVMIDQASQWKLAIDKMIINGAPPDYAPQAVGEFGEKYLFPEYPETESEVAKLFPPSTMIDYDSGYAGFAYDVFQHETSLSLYVKGIEYCQMVNHMLYNDPLDETPFNFQGEDPHPERKERCIGSPGSYMYYKRIVESVPDNNQSS